MDFDRSNKILTLLANFGVVAGLVFLAVEIRQNQVVLEQNQDLMRRQFEVQAVDSHQAIADLTDKIRLLVASDGELTKIWIAGMKGENLSEVDQTRFAALCASKIWNEAVSYRRLKITGASGDAQLMINTMHQQRESSPGYDSCWNDTAEGLTDWGYDDFVNGVSTADPSRRE